MVSTKDERRREQAPRAGVFMHHPAFDDRSGNWLGLDCTTSFAITCFGYDKRETERLRHRFDNEGHSALSDTQKQALLVVLHCDPLWQVKNDLLAIYGLPTTKELFRTVPASHHFSSCIIPAGSGKGTMNCASTTMQSAS